MVEIKFFFFFFFLSSFIDDITFIHGLPVIHMYMDIYI